jgi:hypothetical protein
LLNEQGWNPDLIELHLAHKECNKVRAAYNRAQHLAEKMMQARADYLDSLREGLAPARPQATEIWSSSPPVPDMRCAGQLRYPLPRRCGVTFEYEGLMT